MKRFVIASSLALLFASTAANAADNRIEMPMQELLASQEARDAGIDGSVRFFLAGQSHPRVASRHGEGVSNRRTNGVGKSDEESCRRAALSALLAFQKSAQARGANAVVNITSYFKRNTFSSPTHYECHAGGVMSAVTLKGTYATIP